MIIDIIDHWWFIYQTIRKLLIKLDALPFVYIRLLRMMILLLQHDLIYILPIPYNHLQGICISSFFYFNPGCESAMRMCWQNFRCCKMDVTCPYCGNHACCLPYVSDHPHMLPNHLLLLQFDHELPYQLYRYIRWRHTIFHVFLLNYIMFFSSIIVCKFEYYCLIIFIKIFFSTSF